MLESPCECGFHNPWREWVSYLLKDNGWKTENHSVCINLRRYRTTTNFSTLYVRVYVYKNKYIKSKKIKYEFLHSRGTPTSESFTRPWTGMRELWDLLSPNLRVRHFMNTQWSCASDDLIVLRKQLNGC